MAEIPFDKPTQDISWADSGTKTEPSVGRKSTGWVSAGDRPAPEFNWRYNKVSDHIDFVDAYLPRKFSGADSALEAIGKTEPGDQIILTDAQSWYAAPIEKETVSSGSFSNVISDGARLYGFKTVRFYAIVAEVATESEVLWTVNFSGVLSSFIGPSVDGGIVAIAGKSSTADGYELHIYSNADLGANPVILTGVAGEEDVIEVRADSTSATLRVWVGVNNTTDVQGELWLWTPAGGLVLVATAWTGLSNMGMCSSAIAMQHGDKIFFVDKETYVTTESPLDVTDIDDIYGDGETLYVLTDTQIHAIGVNSNLDPAVGSLVFELAIGGALEEVLVVGDGVAYTPKGAYSLASGQLIEEWAPIFSPTSALALAGQYLWGTVVGGPTFFGSRSVGLRGGEVWVRKSDGSDEAIGRSDSELRLIERQKQ